MPKKDEIPIHTLFDRACVRVCVEQLVHLFNALELKYSCCACGHYAPDLLPAPIRTPPTQAHRYTLLLLMKTGSYCILLSFRLHIVQGLAIEGAHQ